MVKDLLGMFTTMSNKNSATHGLTREDAEFYFPLHEYGRQVTGSQVITSLSYHLPALTEAQIPFLMGHVHWTGFLIKSDFFFFCLSLQIVVNLGSDTSPMG